MKRRAARRIDRIAFERLLAELAARFADVRPDEVRAEIERALERLVGFFGYDRCTYSEFADDGTLQVLASAATGSTAPHRIGPFDASLKSGGDREWGGRVARSGLGILYAGDAVVGHPARRTLAELGHKVRRIAGGRAARLRREHGRPRLRLLRDVIVSLRPPVTAIPRILRDPRIPPRSRAGVFAVAVYVRYRTAWERLRLLLGAAATR